MHSIPLAVVCALDDEVRPVASKMEVDSRLHRRPALFTVGKFGRTPLVLVRSGIGRQAMAAAAAHLIAQYRPDFCLHVGYCGGADPQDQAGDLIIADAVADAASGERFLSEPAVVERAVRLCAERNLRARAGAIITVEKVVEAPHEKAFIGTQHGAIGIDMESAPLVAACVAAGVPSLVVRAVLDPLDVSLPDMGDAITEEGATDGMKLAEHLLRKPKDFWNLPRLQYFAAQARAAIAAFVEAWMEQGER